MTHKRRDREKSSRNVRKEFLSLKTRIHEFVQKELDQFYHVIAPLLTEVKKILFQEILRIENIGLKSTAIFISFESLGM